MAKNLTTREESYIKNIIPDGESSQIIIDFFNDIITQAGGRFIKATNVSQTIDFGDLLDGDIVKHYVAIGTLVDIVVISTDGDLGEAAVVDDYYEVVR